MEQNENSEPRWFEPEHWDGQDSSFPEEPWVPDEADRLLHPELFEGPEALPLPAAPSSSPSVPSPPARRPRRDGFTPERQEQFLELVRGGASGREAARRIHISPTTAYNLYNSPEGAAFRDAWDEAARVADIVLEDTAFDRAVNGQEEIIYYQGRRRGVRWKYDNKLLMQLLRARNPLKYAPLSEIEGWLRHRGIAAPADVDGALARLRSAEAAHQLPVGEAPALSAPAPLPPGERDAEAEPRQGEGLKSAARAIPSTSPEPDDSSPTSTSSTSPEAAESEEVPIPSMSSTSPDIGPAEEPSGASKSSTSPETGQSGEASIPSNSSTPPETGPPEEPSGASKSSTSSETGQEPAAPAGPAPLPEPEPAEGPPPAIFRPPPRPRMILL